MFLEASGSRFDIVAFVLDQSVEAYLLSGVLVAEVA